MNAPEDASSRKPLARPPSFALLAVMSIAAAGCGSSSSGGSSVGVDAGPSDAAAGTDAPSVGGSGNGTVMGSIDGSPFGAVGGALWAGAPDDPTTTVVYVFSKPVACGELQNPGWDTKIPEGTRVLEMKAFGSDLKTYTVVTTPTPAPGEASVNYTLSSQTATPKEESSRAGDVSLAGLTPKTSVQGTFSLTFASSTLAGTFDAVFCPGGHEP